MKLSDAQRDALTEVINIGASKAGTRLSALADDTIEMRVPEVRLVGHEELVRILDVTAGDEMVCIQQQADGLITGHILLLFSSRESRQLVAILTKPLQPLSAGSDDEIRRFEHEATTEFGNIVLSGCVGAMASFLGGRVKLKVPQYNEGTFEQILSNVVQPLGERQALIMRTSLRSMRREVTGTIIITLTIDDMKALLGRLDEILASLPDGAAGAAGAAGE
jgi:chemotaxis protein CheC